MSEHIQCPLLSPPINTATTTITWNICRNCDRQNVALGFFIIIGMIIPGLVGFYFSAAFVDSSDIDVQLYIWMVYMTAVNIIGGSILGYFPYLTCRKVARTVTRTNSNGSYTIQPNLRSLESTTFTCKENTTIWICILLWISTMIWNLILFYIVFEAGMEFYEDHYESLFVFFVYYLIWSHLCLCGCLLYCAYFIKKLYEQEEPLGLV